MFAGSERILRHKTEAPLKKPNEKMRLVRLTRASCALVTPVGCPGVTDDDVDVEDDVASTSIAPKTHLKKAVCTVREQVCTERVASNSRAAPLFFFISL